MVEKRKPGRPKGSTKKQPKELSTNEEHWADKLVRLYEEGATDWEVCKALKVSYDQFTKRCKADDIFSELVDYGRLAAKAWWLELGRKGASGKSSINYSVWYAVMKNRYGWSDRVENVNAEGEKPIDQMSQEEIIAAIAMKRGAIDELLKTANVRLDAIGSSDN